MSEKKYENIIKETIILTNLKYLDVYDSIKYDIIKNMKLEKEKNEPNKTEQKIKTEIFEEIFNSLLFCYFIIFFIIPFF